MPVIYYRGGVRKSSCRGTAYCALFYIVSLSIIHSVASLRSLAIKAALELAKRGVDEKRMPVAPVLFPSRTSDSMSPIT